MEGCGLRACKSEQAPDAVAFTATVIFRMCELEVKNQLRMMMKWLLRSNPYWSKERRKIPTPDDGDEREHAEDDETEIEIEGEGAPTRKAEICRSPLQ